MSGAYKCMPAYACGCPPQKITKESRRNEREDAARWRHVTVRRESETTAESRREIGIKLRSREIERKIIKLVEWREFARVGRKERREAVCFETHAKPTTLDAETNDERLSSSLKLFDCC